MNPKVLFFWVLVSLPLGWGLYQSVQKAMPLFQGVNAPAKPGPAAPK